MALGVTSLGTSTGFPGTIAYGASYPVGTWIALAGAYFGNGGGLGPAFDSAGNSFVAASGASTGQGTNNNPTIYLAAVQLAHAVGPTDVITPNVSGSGSFEAFVVTGAPNFLVGRVAAPIKHGEMFPYAPVHELDLRLPAYTAPDEVIIIGGTAAETQNVAGYLSFDIGGNNTALGAGSYGTSGIFTGTMSAGGTAQWGAQVTGPVGDDAEVWSTGAMVLLGLGADGCDGVDLVRSSAGFLFITWQDAGEVFVARSTDQGETFDKIVSVSADGDLCCAPALCIDAHDDLLLAYHTIDPLLRVWHLPGLLEDTPVPAFDFLTITHPYKFPRPLLVRPDLMLLAAINGDNLQVFSSPDYGVTTTLLKDYAQQAKDRAAFGLDRHGIAHLVFRDTLDNLKWDWSADLGGHWSGATTLASSVAKAPVYAVGAHDGFVAYFAAATLTVRALNSDYHSIRATVTAPTATFQKISDAGWVDGLADSGREDWWFLGRALSSGHAQLLCYSPDEGANWTILAGGGL